MMDIARPDSEGIDRILPLKRYPNVYIRTYLSNTSKQRVPCRDMWPYLRKVYDQFGPPRMVFTNFHELLIMKEIIPFFAAEDKEWILGKTALKLYFKQNV
jgi:predicted TIM-barrel fold metal-dependent hydrolase